MIKVKVTRKDSKLVYISLEGHSGYSEEGTDIVCSSVTSMACSIADGIIEILKIKADCKAQKGFICIDLRKNSFYEIEKCQVLMETLLLGLKNIQKNYVGYIKVHEEEV